MEAERRRPLMEGGLGWEEMRRYWGCWGAEEEADSVGAEVPIEEGEAWGITTVAIDVDRRPGGFSFGKSCLWWRSFVSSNSSSQAFNGPLEHSTGGYPGRPGTTS